MSGRINRIPPGLLAVLGTQAQGVNPNDLSQVYVPTLEMRDWMLTTAVTYAAPQITGIGGPGTYEPPNPSAGHVPEGEWWLVYSAGMICVPVVNLTGQLRVTVSSGGGLIPVAASEMFTFTPTNGRALMANIPRPIFLPPNSRFQLQVEAHAGAGQIGTLLLSYARLR